MTGTLEQSAGTARTRTGGRGAPVRRVRPHLPAAWPVYVLFIGYPLWWALGFQLFIWPLLAIPMAVSLLRRRLITVPKGAGLIILFFVWMILSATQLDGFRQLLSFTYRGSLYFSAVVLLLFLVNLPAKHVDVPRLAQAAGWMWVATVVGGLVGLFLAEVSFSSPLEMVLPRSFASQPFIASLVHPEFASESTLLGYAIARPKAPYNYTNEWGANLALLTPLAVYSLQVVRARWWRLLVCSLLIASIVPIVVSINRGLWLSIIVGGAYVGIRAAGRGRVRLLLAVLLAAGATAAFVANTGLADIIADRAERPNIQGRTHLYSEAAEATLTSPVLGHGAPLPSDNLSLTAGASVGTHGQLWTLLVSQGITGLVLFVGFLVATFVFTYRVSRHAFWLHAVLVIAVFQLPFYNSLPVQLHVVMLAVALCWWDIAGRRAASGVPSPHDSRRSPAETADATLPARVRGTVPG